MEQNSNSVKILLVEDDLFMAGLLERKFKQGSYEIMQAPSADQAREILKKGPVSLILLDVILPGTDGISFLKELKSSSELAKIPVIITSNLGSEEEINRGMKEGAIDYIVKAHTTPGEIVSKVEEILSKK